MEFWEQESLREGKENAWQCRECLFWDGGLCWLGLGDGRQDRTEPDEFCRDRELRTRATRVFLRFGSRTFAEHWAKTWRARAKRDLPGQTALGLKEAVAPRSRG